MSHDMEAQVYRVWLMQPEISLDELAALVALPAGLVMHPVAFSAPTENIESVGRGRSAL